MKLRTRLNLVVTGLTAMFVLVLIAAEIEDTRSSVREEIEAANRVGSQLLGRLVAIYSREGGPQVVLEFLQQLGRVRANEVSLWAPGGRVLYRSPPATYKAGREAPRWFEHLLAPQAARHTFYLPDGVQLVVEANPSRAILDAWDDLTRLFEIGTIMLVLVSGLAFWLVGRALAPFPVIAMGLARIEAGDLAFRLPPLAGAEAHAIGAAFNQMAQAVQDKVRVERQAREAESRLEERRELARLVEQRIEEERRLIAHELHDEFGQSVTAIRSLAMAISTQSKDPTMTDAARLISQEASRLYDAMHGLIPRLTPLSLDTLGLADTLENLVRDWQRRYPDVALCARHALAAELGPSVTLTIYRVAQEGLINALRHAHATRVEIDLHAREDRIVLTITDDGVGLPADWARPGHFGLRGLADRVENLGGDFKVGNCEPHGVRLTAEIPLVAGA
ncbi:MAG TPA: ATP-binding protein [Steroidobacteraceae bacterium]|nr:ATP-binding protein [Steroidobacteraceae bacterium]